jgi:hypothetical protein
MEKLYQNLIIVSFQYEYKLLNTVNLIKIFECNFTGKLNVEITK